MAVEPTIPLAALPIGSSLPSLTRVRLLEGSAELLVGQLRLHAKRVRALAAAFRRETRRIGTGSGTEFGRIDQHLDRIATQTTTALAAVDTAFVTTISGVAAMDHLATAVDLAFPDRTPAQRMALLAEELIRGLKSQHTVAHGSLHFIVEQLVVSANNLAIAVGQPGGQSLEQMRIIIRQMRNLSRITAELSSRLDVFVQNQSAALQELIPASPTRDLVLASLRVGSTRIVMSSQEGAR